MKENNDGSIFGNSFPLENLPEMKQEDFRKTIYDMLVALLEREFPDDPAKRRIRIHSDRWQFACPVCRDSAHDHYKKRGNFIFESGPFFNSFKCFNCGTFMSIDRFFKHFDMNIGLDATAYIKINRSENAMFFKPKTSFAESMFNREEMNEKAIPVQTIMNILGCVPVSPATPTAYNYLAGREQYQLYHFLYNDRIKTIYILNTTEKGGVISFQSRNISPTYHGPKYVTVDLKRLHSQILKDGVEISDIMNSLSMLYNLYMINADKPLLMTEGPMDSYLLPNCIASLGSTKHVDIGLPLWYVYDSDNAGTSQAARKLENGSHVFMWEKLKSEYNLPVRKKWDINDFMIWCRKSEHKPPVSWSRFFTDDALDILEI